MTAPEPLDDADRDAFAQVLGRHYVAGHLEAAELDVRLGTVYGAGARAGLEAAVADLPPLGAAAPETPRRRFGLRRRGHGESEAAQPGWRPTRERFVDPTTSRVMRVWLDLGGARHYVPDDAGS